MERLSVEGILNTAIADTARSALRQLDDSLITRFNDIVSRCCSRLLGLSLLSLALLLTASLIQDYTSLCKSIPRYLRATIAGEG
jgi:hypothetical protein